MFFGNAFGEKKLDTLTQVFFIGDDRPLAPLAIDATVATGQHE